MDEILTIEEIEARYAPEYVLVGEPTTDEYQSLRSGRVLFHSMDRDEVARKVREYPPGRYALWYLGSFPDDMALVLLHADRIGKSVRDLRLAGALVE